MNEKLSELALQAGLTGYFAADHPDLATIIPISYEEQKFAELIIKECVSLFDGSREMKTVGLLSHEQVIKQINRHFGVE